MKQRHIELTIALCLVSLGIILRLLPHPPNFVPLAAIALFGGAILPRKLAVWVPLLAMIVSDAIIGFYSTMFVTWACFALIALASSIWLRKPSLVKAALFSLSSSVFFYIVTNFSVWAGTAMYAHTWKGLVDCYAMAVPFFRNTVLGDLFYTMAFFGLYSYALYRSKKLLHHELITTDK
jgi:hypothetical protein